MTIPDCEQSIAEVEAFMLTKAYAVRQESAQADLDTNAHAIVSVIPDSESAVALLLQLHGNRYVLQQNLSEFESSLVALRAKLLEMKERQTKPE